MTAPGVNFAHLIAMSDEVGTFEHARFATPRLEHGYCTDDVARVVVVVAREGASSGPLRDLLSGSLRFLAQAQHPDGRCRNRRDYRGHWRGDWTAEDCWGRLLWGAGTAAARASDEADRHVALDVFERGAQIRSPWTRATAFAALGAFEVLRCEPSHRLARELLADALEVVSGPWVDVRWRWPEVRLTYANAVLAQARLEAAWALGREEHVELALAQLEWLLGVESTAAHLSVTPVGGRGPGESGPSFDQQPIEVAALADACASAWRLTGDQRWREGMEMAVGWFEGANDIGVPMYDKGTGGGYDGLTQNGPNLNQGAESTLALLATLQHARLLEGVAS